MCTKKVLVITAYIALSISSLRGGDGAQDLTLGRMDGFIAYAIAIQKDGKLVATGRTTAGKIQTMRFTSMGMVDTTFGFQGKATGVDGTAYALFIQPDGNIVIGGQLASGQSFVYRYRSDGTLDSSFGAEGYIRGSSTSTVYAINMQLDGRLLIGINTETDTRLLRYSDHDLFATQLQAIANVVGSAIMVQTDDKVIIGGTENSNTFFLARCLADGPLDQSFGIDGIVDSPLGLLAGIALQSDGKMVAGGYTAPSSGDFQIVRFMSDGTLDTTFGTGGVTTGPDGIVHSMIMQPDEKSILVGKNSSDVCQLVRYTTTGVLDTTFNNTGIITGSFDSATGGSLQFDGKIFVIECNDDLLFSQIVRYMAQSALLTPAITSPVADAVLLDSMVEFEGTAQAESRIFLCIDGVTQEEGTVADNSNQWTMTVIVPASGPHTVYAICICQDANLSVASSTIPFTMNIITIPLT
jgi:uncharacterized delta-60 repeat protein